MITRYIEKVKPFTCDFIRRHTDTAENADRIIESLDECYEEGAKAKRARAEAQEKYLIATNPNHSKRTGGLNQ